MPDGKAGHAIVARGGCGAVDATGKGGLGKAHARIDQNRSGAGLGHLWFDGAVDAARAQLLAIALEIVEAADAVADAFGGTDGAGDLCGDPRGGPMANEGRHGTGLDVIQVYVGHGALSGDVCADSYGCAGGARSIQSF